MMKSKALKLIISILLIISVLCFSFSAFAVDGAESVQAKEALICYYIWQFLHSIGIDVTYQDVLEYNDYIQDTIIDWVMDYIADEIEADSMPSNYTIAKWVAPWQVGYDYWGNLQYNSTMLEDIQDFANWLKRKFSLVDDDTYVVGGVDTLNGYTLYLPETYYLLKDPTTEKMYIFYYSWVGYSNVQDIYVFFPTIGDITYYGQITTNPSYSSYGTGYHFVDSSFNEVSLIQIGGNSFGAPNAYGVRYSFASTVNADDQVIPNGNRFIGSNAEWDAFVPTMRIQQEGGIAILTGEIVMPIDNPSYTSGDGVTIVDGSPVYEPITFSGEITNLPAVVSTRDIQNPGIDTVFQPVKAFVTMARDSMELFIQLIYRLPVEANVCIYAVMGSMILLGIIKIMREH